MDDLVIDTENLSLKAGYRYLLNDINWQVKRGEHWLVFGMNGCGKTTLLSILAGFKQPTRGNVRVLGEAYTADNILEMRKKIGWVSSSFFDQIYSREAALDVVLSGKFRHGRLRYEYLRYRYQKSQIVIERNCIWKVKFIVRFI